MFIECEVCGSQSIIKRDGLFVCQECGIKYSLSEIKSILSQKDYLNDTEIRPTSESGYDIIEKYYKGVFSETEVIDALNEGSIRANDEWANGEEKASLLVIAISKNDTYLIDTLLKLGCDVNADSYLKNKKKKINHCFPLSMVVFSNWNPRLFHKLLNNGADIHKLQKTDIGSFDLLTVMSPIVDNESIVVELVGAGLDPNINIPKKRAKNESIKWPLLLSLANKKYKTAQGLIQCGAKINQIIKGQDADFSLLSLMILNNNTKGFNLLIEAGADPNCVRRSLIGYGDNPALFDAVWLKRYDMAKQLIEAGAKVNCFQFDEGHKTYPIQVARENRDSKMEQLLLSYGAKNCLR